MHGGAERTDTHRRIVVDESSLDFRGLPDNEVEAALDDLNDALDRLLRDGREPMTTSLLYSDVECRDGVELHELLFSRATSVDPDTCRRTALLLDRCADWDDDCPDNWAPMTLPDCPITAFSVGFAAALRLRGKAVGCLVVRTCHREGWLPVDVGSGPVTLFFFSAPGEVRQVWRAAFTVEHVREHDFLAVARSAFPSLVFHDDLRFGKFTGSYADLRDDVVRILAVLDDHFEDTMGRHVRRPEAVVAELRHHGVVVSPESPNTRKSQKLMRHRDVHHEGSTYRCEWHAKIEPHRNRIHFSLPAEGPGGRMLIGIFTDHLPT